MKKFKKSAKSVVLFLFMFIIGCTGIFAYLEEQKVSFQFKGKEHLVEVRQTGTGTDILLSTPGEELKNLTALLPGENLFPVVTVNNPGNRFTVSWLQYRRGNVQLGLYDSQIDQSRPLHLDKFKYAKPLRAIFYDNIPYLLLFKGNNSDNTDIFYYHLENGRVKNITQTPGSEQTVDILDEENRFFIETATLYHHYRYRLKKRSLRITLTKKLEIEQERHRPAAVDSSLAMNTIAAFGDSITWGRMYMDDLEGDYHPELAYLAQMQQILADNYGETSIVNLGFPGDSALAGTQRMDEDFPEIDAFFCLVMFGTNDVILGIDPDATTENLEYIVTRARKVYKMYPVISTIPPQRRHTPDQYRKEQSEALNARIIEMAVENDIPYIDSYTALMQHPAGLPALTEDVKGTHPSPLGHQVIAELFKEKVLEPPPAKPMDVVESVSSSSAKTVAWSANEEFDFGSYRIEFGYTRGSLNRQVSTPDNFYRFIPLPLASSFDTVIYFRIQSVDLDGNGSDFTTIKRIEFD